MTGAMLGRGGGKWQGRRLAGAAVDGRGGGSGQGRRQMARAAAPIRGAGRWQGGGGGQERRRMSGMAECRGGGGAGKIQPVEVRPVEMAGEKVWPGLGAPGEGWRMGGRRRRRRRDPAPGRSGGGEIQPVEGPAGRDGRGEGAAGRWCAGRGAPRHNVAVRGDGRAVKNPRARGKGTAGMGCLGF